MPTAAHKTAISFGLVYIPVELYTATQENRVSFNQLHKDSHARIRYKKVREDTGEEVSSGDIVKGYQYAKDQYVVLTDDELERMKSEKDRRIEIVQFVPAASIDPIFYDKSYFVVPAGSDKAYGLLRAAMEQAQVVAIAKTVLTTKETMLALAPCDEGIMMETLFYIDEVKSMPAPYRKTEISEAELNMGKMLIESMKGHYQPELYHDTYEAKLMEAIQQKIGGQQQVAAPQPQVASNVIDLMEALQRSLAQKGEPSTPTNELEEKRKHSPVYAGMR